MMLQRFLLCLLLLVCVVACSTDNEETRELQDVRTAYTEGFYLKARAGYEQYLQRFPQGQFRFEAWNRLLEIAVDVSGDQKRAISILEAMILEYDQDQEIAWELMNHLAELYEQNGQIMQALETRDKSLFFVGEDTQRMLITRLAIASLQRSRLEYTSALAMLNTCLEKVDNPKLRARCLYEKAQTYTLMQKLGQAKTILNSILDAKEADVRVYSQAVFLLADVYEQELNFDKARQLFESIKDSYPNPKVIELRLLNMGKDRP